MKYQIFPMQKYSAKNLYCDFKKAIPLSIIKSDHEYSKLSG